MRLFTFGCSLTLYHYPTWADIVSKNFSHFENWGRPSSGNNYILNALHRCHLTNKLSSDDTVIVLWSGLARIDCFQVNHWKHVHQQYFDLGDEHSHFSCPEGYQWLSFSWMASAVHMLQNLNVNYKMFHWQPIDKHTEPYKMYEPILNSITFAPFDANKQSYPRHRPSLSIAQNSYDRMAGPDWPSLQSILDNSFINTVRSLEILNEISDFVRYLKNDPRINTKVYEIDGHPSPRSHLNWAKKYLPSYSVSQQTVDWIEDIDQKLLTQQPYNFEFKQI